MRHSIERERAFVAADEEYSLAAVLWFPVKAYYLLYHVLCLIDFLLSATRENLRMSHTSCLKAFSERLAHGEISFSESRFNDVYDRRILSFKERSGEHLSSAANDDLLFRLAMKKIARYKIEEYRRAASINTKKKEGRVKLKSYIGSKLTVSIFDFFYFMSVKPRYRDFNFITDISPSLTARYFFAYHDMTVNLYRCFTATRAQLTTAVRR